MSQLKRRLNAITITSATCFLFPVAMWDFITIPMELWPDLKSSVLCYSSNVLGHTFIFLHRLYVTLCDLFLSQSALFMHWITEN
ncbi:hypothetical protein OIU77_001869 [Salix suchowensis]|uniref:Uncharacterized protein n=1 Tax=Salix suchowensis TaxID=1278906 RepID=A0ABQ9B523_9ROSI|nr:hypothetical protein OIU77_001869 [Salix suchowensis]